MDKETQESNAIFKEAVSILNQNNVFFWIDQGTLLGCVRENRLLPWDHDIDFGVWGNAVEKNLIISSFVNAGFTIEEIPMEMHCIHFLKGNNKKIDITLYDREGNMAITRWAAPNKGIACRIINNIIQGLETSQQSLFYNKRGKFAESIFRILKIVLHFIPKSLRKSLLERIKLLSIKYPEMEVVKFNIPLTILSNFQNINFLDMKVQIPVDSIKYLSYVYGEDWRVPKQKFDWRQDCGGLNTVEQNIV